MEVASVTLISSYKEIVVFVQLILTYLKIILARFVPKFILAVLYAHKMVVVRVRRITS